MEICASTYSSAKLKIRTYMYESSMQKHTDCRLTDELDSSTVSLTDTLTTSTAPRTHAHTHTHTHTDREG